MLSASGESDIKVGLLNSLIITAGSIVVLVLSARSPVTSSPAGRALEPGMFYLFLIAIMLPIQLGTVPLYIGARTVDLIGSPWG